MDQKSLHVNSESCEQVSKFSFGSVVRLLGEEAFGKLSSSKVVVVGLGGVGSWAAEALVRSGVGELHLMDLDEICVTNINRQVQATYSQVGKAKVEVLEKRFLDISPKCRVHKILDFLDEDNLSVVSELKPDLVLDCIDSLKPKVALIKHCRELGIPLVVAGSAGGKMNPFRLETSDLTQAKNDALLARVRKTLRQNHGFERSLRKKWDLPCVFSSETSVVPEGGEAGSRRMDCGTGLGALVTVTATMGLMMAGLGMDLLTQESSHSREN